jgi:hypothetical protein
MLMELKTCYNMYSKGSFITNFETIVIESPELHDVTTIQHYGADIRESKLEKNSGSALQRVLDYKTLEYQAIAFSDDKQKKYVLSKQFASMKKNKKGKTAKGDRRELYPYLVFLVLAVEATTQAQDGHVLGIMTSVLDGYCAACTAGLGICRHKKACLYTQLHRWGQNGM